MNSGMLADANKGAPPNVGSGGRTGVGLHTFFGVVLEMAAVQGFIGCIGNAVPFVKALVCREPSFCST